MLYLVSKMYAISREYFIGFLQKKSRKAVEEVATVEIFCFLCHPLGVHSNSEYFSSY